MEVRNVFQTSVSLDYVSCSEIRKTGKRQITGVEYFTYVLCNTEPNKWILDVLN
jgi:hypothetical protein